MIDEPAITSPRNPRLRAALALRDRRERQRSGLTLVDGARETARALDGDVPVETVFVCRELLHGERGAAFVARLESLAGADRPEVIEVGRTAHDRLAYGQRGDGVVAIVRVPQRTLAGLRLPASPLVAVLAGIEKPGNLGAILRSADGAGVDAVVVADAATDLYNPNTIRASLGTVFNLPTVAADVQAVCDWLADQRLQTVVARVDAPLTYDAADLRVPTAIVLGNEAEGLDERWSGPGVVAVRLPMLGAADSLNVAAAAAVLFYEARRQRGVRDGHGPLEGRRPRATLPPSRR